MVIGVDFDNTVVCYDGIFKRLAVELGLVAERSFSDKVSLRDKLRAEGREDDWTLLQGQVYGPGMSAALPFPGVVDFFVRCRERKISLYIISHRTKTPYLGESFDLHQAALGWLENNSFYQSPVELARKRVFFESTKEEKLARIESLECDIFVDDLPEFLAEEDFCKKTRRILFDPSDRHPDSEFERLTQWNDATRLLGLD